MTLRTCHCHRTGITVGTFADVAKWADALVLSVLGSAADEALRQAGPENCEGSW